MAVKDKKDTKKKTSMSIDVVDISGKKKGTTTLPRQLFDVPLNTALIAQSVRVYLSNQRQSSAVAKTRGEVTGSGKKIWRQKGTGKARHGHRYAGLFVGGGKAHGPRPRTFNMSLNRKMKQKALSSSLSAQLKKGNILVVDGIEKISSKTKELVHILDKITKKVKQGKVLEKTLLATSEKVESVYRAGKNIENLTIREASLLNTYEVVNNRKIIFSKKAIEKLEEKTKLL